MGQVDDLYDWILIDTPPDLATGTTMAIIAANLVVIPFKPEAESVSGIYPTLEMVDNTRAAYDPGPIVLCGFASNMELRTIDNRQSASDGSVVLSDYQKSMPSMFLDDEPMLDVVVRHSTNISSAYRDMCPSNYETKKGPAAEDYKGVVDAMISKMKSKGWL